MTPIAICKGNKAALQDFDYSLENDRVTLNITTGNEDDWMHFFKDQFVFVGISEIFAFPVKADDAESRKERGVAIYEHDSDQEGIRHFSFLLMEIGAEIHLKAREFSVAME